jgi:flagellar basal body P-ring formation protein FlgA
MIASSIKAAIGAAIMSLIAMPTHADEAMWGAADIRTVVQDYFVANGKALPPDAQIGPLDDRLKVAACATSPLVQPRSAYSSSLVITCNAPVSWNFTVRVEGIEAPPAVTVPRAVSAGGPVKQWNVIVPRVALAAGTILTSDMLEERVTNQPPGGALMKGVSEAVGLRLVAALQPGNVLTTRNVARAPTVMKGETITLIAEGEGFSISATARAEEDGFEGDLVSVRNVKSGVVLSGRVAQSGTVIIR